MTTPQLSLYELNNLVRSVIEGTLSDEYWLKAELSEVRQGRGHCYLEFVQKDENGNGLLAKARGQIWANRWSVISPYFERTTGQTLSAGMQVLVKVQVTFHELYGYSLNVVDIDPAFTLGDIARKRQEIIRQLEREGVLNMNKELDFPRLLQRIAVISSPTAAGYGDFCNQLENNKSNLVFYTQLFPSIMQGDGVERSIISALNAIAANLNLWDAVVIIRGGGATSDLSGFDTLALAENVAQFPLPIITGIGHERDDTVIDMVSHTRVKTPTAAAAFLIQHQENELNAILDLSERMVNAALNTMKDEKLRIDRIISKLPSVFSYIKEKERRRLDKLTYLLSGETKSYIEQRATRMKMLEQRMLLVSSNLLVNRKHHLDILKNKVDYASPEKLLKLGYSITRVNGRAVTDSGCLKEGDVLTTEFASGKAISVVNKIDVRKD